MSLPTPIGHHLFSVPQQVTDKARPVSMRSKKTKVSNTPKPFASVEQIAHETGIAWRTARNRLKAAGLLPIEGHTRAEILDAIKPPTGDKPGDSIKEKLTYEQWRKFRIKNDADEGILVHRAKVAATVRVLAGKFTKLLDAKLEDEYPAAVAGLDVPGARAFGKRLNDEIRAEVQRWAAEWEGA